jgi:stage II sporulation protein D
MARPLIRASIALFLAALVVTALTVACGGRIRPASIDPGAHAPTHLRIRLDGGAIQQIPLEEYVRGTIITEVSPAGGDATTVERMLEVQAIVARSYAIAQQSRHRREGFDLCSTTHCQLYQPARLKSSTWARAADTAVQRTAGRVLWYGTSVASTLFHADCGGQTSADGDVWGGSPLPYLAGVQDDGPARTAHTTWRFEIDRAKLLAALNRSERTRVGEQLTEIAVVKRDEAGRAALVALRGAREAVVRGEDVRVVLSQAFGARSIRSTRFEIARSGSTFTFTGTGFGHGVGLCQAGALARLGAGARPDQVLSRYFPGTRIVALR